MLGTYYYHEILRKTVIAFGTLFNDIHICKKRLSLVKKYKFDPHLSLAYGLFEKEKVHNVMKNIIIPKYVVFSGISIVKTGRDVKKWETVFQRKF